MGYKTRLIAQVIAFVGFALVAAAGFVYWGIALHTGDPTAQVFGIVVGGTFGVMWLAFVLVAAESRKPTRRPCGYRY